MENEHNNAVPEEKKPGYPMHKRKYTPLYTIIVFLYGLLVKLLFHQPRPAMHNRDVVTRMT